MIKSMQFFSDMFDFSICFSRPEAARDYTKKRLPARIS